jgi:hypothetical protein
MCSPPHVDVGEQGKRRQRCQGQDNPGQRGDRWNGWTWHILKDPDGNESCYGAPTLPDRV